MPPFTAAMTADAAENPRATMGGNSPPLKDFFADINTTLPDYLRRDNADIITRAEELLEGFDRAPETIESQEVAGKISDFIAQFNACVKQAEAKRVDIKAGPLAAGRLIDGFFQKNILDRLTPAKTKLLARLTAWEQKKAAEERARREEEARIAEAARKEAERIARLEAERVERERIAAEAAERERLAKIKTETDLQKAVELEAENQRIAAESAARAKAAAEEAERQRMAAEKAQSEAAEKAAAMHTTRGDMGSSSNLRTVWVARITDADAIDLNALRAFIPQDAIQKALNQYVKINKDQRPMKGVHFGQESSAVVRG